MEVSPESDITIYESVSVAVLSLVAVKVSVASNASGRVFGIIVTRADSNKNDPAMMSPMIQRMATIQRPCFDEPFGLVGTNGTSFGNDRAGFGAIEKFRGSRLPG